MRYLFLQILFLSITTLGTANVANRHNAASMSNSDYSSEIGYPLRKWAKGEMDIFQINTGRGENYFMIFPDSTSLMLDCGEVPYDENMNPARPDNTKRAGEWIVRFISDVNPRQSNVDYYFNSHFHIDHVGSPIGVTDTVWTGLDGMLAYFIPTGISLAGSILNINKVVDRGYPWYQVPQNNMGLQPHVVNYRKFLHWRTLNTTMTGEMFLVGSNNQFKLNYQPDEYPSFKVQNLFANGQVWTGSNLDVIDYVHKNPKNLEKTINENSLSCGVRIHYGNFTYYTGGDITGTLLNENNVAVHMEAVIKEIVGEVDVCKANHHAYTGSMTPEFVNTARAKVYLLPYLNSLHLQTDILDNITANHAYGDSCLLVPTYLSENQKESLVTAKYYNQITETGHALIRVLNGGNEYVLYILCDQDESKTVKAVYGPFSSKSRVSSAIAKPRVIKQIMLDDGFLTVHAENKASVCIYSVRGECLVNETFEQTFRCKLNKGLYILRVDEETRKIFVK